MEVWIKQIKQKTLETEKQEKEMTQNSKKICTYETKNGEKMKQRSFFEQKDFPPRGYGQGGGGAYPLNGKNKQYLTGSLRNMDERERNKEAVQVFCA